MSSRERITRRLWPALRRLAACRSGGAPVARTLVAHGGTEEDHEGHTRIAVVARGREARDALLRMAATPLVEAASDLRFEWEPPGPAAAAPHLVLTFGTPGAAHLALAPEGLALHLGSLQWMGPAAPGTPVAWQALAALDVTRALLVRGHVCVDFEDVRKVLPRATHGAIGQGHGPDRIEQAFTWLSQHEGPPPWRTADHAVAIVSFPAGGGKLMESKQALNLLRERLAPDAFVIYATTTDPALARGQVRVTVLFGRA